MVFLDTTVVNVALPSIGHGLGLGESGLAWVVGAYQLTFGGFQLVGGRAADLLGRRRLFLAGVLVFTAASLAAGLAPSAAVLLAARAAQGVGAALVVPAEISLLAVTFPDSRDYARAFGVWSAMGAAGAAAGTALGGILTQGLGWPSIFLINLPIGAAAVALTRRLLPADAAGVGGRHPWRRLDLPGAALGTGGLVLVVYAITASAGRGLDVATMTTCALGLLLLAGFSWHETHAVRPLMPLRLYRVRNVTGSTLVNFLVGAAHVPAFVLLALYLQHVAGYSPMTSGFAVLPVAVVNMAVARTVLPAALARFGARVVLTGGMVLLAIGLGGLARVPVHGSYLLDVLPAGLVFGVGLPAAFAGVTIPAVTSVAEVDTGITAGIVQTAQRVGAALGATAATALAAAWTAGHTGPPLQTYTGGLRVAFAAAAGTAALGAVLAATIIRSPGTPRVEHDNHDASFDEQAPSRQER
ncbi:MFS transporter [Amycolatopsis alkalitolerans]|uniref:MFS transporter n=2 Tax=Amycolatopsis alkalitolerans TaxID=2547244 RepID=A0A5C4MAM4_9PSEU|nr:MFS transporter [Amycolatopsis alkalitolerans]